MFSKSNIILKIGSRDNADYEVLTLNSSSKQTITKMFSNITHKLINTASSKKIMFNGKYKAEADELLYIPNYKLPASLINALSNTSVLNSYRLKNNKVRSIILAGEHENKKIIAFQYFRTEQYLTNRGYQVFYDKETFYVEKNPGLSILHTIDCFYYDKKLYFNSYTIANRILSLVNYYRIATNNDLNSFTKNKNLAISSDIDITELSDTIIRRKVAELIDYNFFESYTVDQIQKEAKRIGFNIEQKNNKIVIPNNRKQLKSLVKFLSNEIYLGSFDKRLHESNSSKFLLS